jgi:hypothetical protein
MRSPLAQGPRVPASPADRYVAAAAALAAAALAAAALAAAASFRRFNRTKSHRRSVMRAPHWQCAHHAGNARA